MRLIDADALRDVVQAMRDWGPGEVIVDEGTVLEYVDCARCHTLCLIVDGEPVAKARAW